MPAPAVFLSRGLHILQRQARCGGAFKLKLSALILPGSHLVQFYWPGGAWTWQDAVKYMDGEKIDGQKVNVSRAEGRPPIRCPSANLALSCIRSKFVHAVFAAFLPSFLEPIWLFDLPLLQRSDAAMKALARILANRIQSTPEPWSVGTVWCNLDTKAQKRRWAKEGREKWKKWKRLWKRWKRQGGWKRWWKNVAEKDGTPGQKGFSFQGTQQDLFLFFPSAFLFLFFDILLTI